MSASEEQFAAARIAKDKVRNLLQGVPEVTGVGITQVDDQYAVKVNLSGAAEKDSIPNQVDGVPIVVHQTGAFHKQ